jgi:hypothetical protein
LLVHFCRYDVQMFAVVHDLRRRPLPRHAMPVELLAVAAAYGSYASANHAATLRRKRRARCRAHCA